MTDIVFHLADRAMATCFESFFNRDKFNLSLGCNPFSYEILQVPGCTDPGVCWDAHINLEIYKGKCKKAIIVLDEQWGGSEEIGGAEGIREYISKNMIARGWSDDDFKVIVIEPELEAWLWQDNPNIEKAFKYIGPPSLKFHLESKNLWDSNLPKPNDPKEAFHEAMNTGKSVSSSAAMKAICSKVSVSGCIDNSFKDMANTLQSWFPIHYGVVQ